MRSALTTVTSSVDGWTWQPARSDVVRSFAWAAQLLVLFVAVYGTCNWATAARAHRWQLWMDWELAIPYLPWMVWPYLSLALSFFMPMFALRAPAIDALCRRLASALLLSGAIFLLLPAQSGFERPAFPPSQAFALIYALDLPHNLVPSLHVSWGAILLCSLRRVSSPALRRLFEIWFVVLCAAVLFTHQHHVLDVAGGLLVACVAWRAVRANGSWALTGGGSA